MLEPGRIVKLERLSWSKDSSVKKKVHREVDFSNLGLESYHRLIRKLKLVFQNTYTWTLHDFHFFDMKSSKFIKSATPCSETRS